MSDDGIRVYAWEDFDGVCWMGASVVTDCTVAFTRRAQVPCDASHEHREALGRRLADEVRQARAEE